MFCLCNARCVGLYIWWPNTSTGVRYFGVVWYELGFTKKVVDNITRAAVVGQTNLH